MPMEGTHLMDYQDSLIQLRSENGDMNGVGGDTGMSEGREVRIKTDVQMLFICALIGPLVHRFEKVQIGGTTGHFLVVLVELFAMVTNSMEGAATSPGLFTLEQIIDFIHHVRGQISKEPDTSSRLALALKGMRPWLQERLGGIV
ncbi:hypothetical protein BGW38_009774 [Lunasporangiospora selenospora]|uniref:Uncharacterized protein n=1 Tax=Lunasporangiospora selenospora TaxID=979761 RepID=A0A9P6KIL7_9FUNG|nr:hypothetical protein BGW38_009774 [Lunasporangiospora selenospora]